MNNNQEDINAIAYSVYDDLEFIDIENVWDNSGSTRDGYVDPYEYAYSLYEDTLKEYLDELEKEPNYYFMGILKGIYLFETESTSEFKNWADVGEEYFRSILDDWKKDCDNEKDIVEMNNFIQEHCPQWCD